MSACRKFGKQLQRQQLDLPEYAASFLNYKALKKVIQPICRPISNTQPTLLELIKQLSATPTITAQGASPTSLDAKDALRANKEVFFFRLVSKMYLQAGMPLTVFQEREIERVNVFYLQKEEEVRS